MANRTRPEDLGAALARELTIYGASVNEEIDRAAQDAVKDLVRKTKATAPRGARGSFRKNISSKLLKRSNRGSVYVWYVKAPDYRLTHLLVHGHAKKNGGRTKGNPFLQNALSSVFPAFEDRVKEAIRRVSK